MGFSKSSAKREVYSNARHIKNIKQHNFIPKATRKKKNRRTLKLVEEKKS